MLLRQIQPTNASGGVRDTVLQRREITRGSAAASSSRAVRTDDSDHVTGRDGQVEIVEQDAVGVTTGKGRPGDGVAVMGTIVAPDRRLPTK